VVCVIWRSLAPSPAVIDRPDSDIDIAVESEAGRSFSLIRMEETRLFLEEALQRRVDLGEIDSLRPQVRAAFEHERVPHLLSSL
jgi:predicted nucleotidyltransferase